MVARLFRIKQVKTTKKIWQNSFSSKKNGENRTKRVLDNLKMPELEEIFLTVAIVSSLRETRSSAKCFRYYYALSKGKR